MSEVLLILVVLMLLWVVVLNMLFEEWVCCERVGYMRGLVDRVSVSRANVDT